MTKEQRQTEDLVRKYIAMIDKQRRHVQSIQGTNSQFSEIQKAYLQSITSCIDKAEKRMHEVRNGAVWDNLVIAFFGETNAGKSTLLETFRILYGEKTRAQALTQRPEGVDGEIVGNGVSDFTQTYTEYQMNIEGFPFTLIDVPGIEGNEAEYNEQIKKALAKAHLVFYVQGQNKKPDSGTATKIKDYLREWVKVYSIHNIRGAEGHYDEPEERDKLLTAQNEKLASEISETFTSILGDTYQGNISLQGYLALCSKAKFSSERKDLQRAQKNLLSYFGNAESIYRFSNFELLIQLVAQKAKNFTPEIVEANKEKHKALLHAMYGDIKKAGTKQSKAIKEFEQKLKKFKKDVLQDISSASSAISLRFKRLFDKLFDDIEAKGSEIINNDNIYDKKTQSKKEFAKLTQQSSEYLKQCISEELSILKEHVNQRKQNLNQDLGYINYNFNICPLNLNLDNALKQLTYNSSDFAEAAVNIVLNLVNSKERNDWIIALLNLLTEFINRRAKKNNVRKQMLEQMLEALMKAKREAKPNLEKNITKIIQNLDGFGATFTYSIEEELSRLQKLKDYILKIEIKIKKEYSTLNVKKYGYIN